MKFVVVHAPADRPTAALVNQALCEVDGCEAKLMEYSHPRPIAPDELVVLILSASAGDLPVYYLDFSRLGTRIPVRIDDAPVPALLGDIKGIDLRGKTSSERRDAVQRAVQPLLQRYRP